jgi:hypothetical protein
MAHGASMAVSKARKVGYHPPLGGPLSVSISSEELEELVLEVGYIGNGAGLGDLDEK